MSTASDSFILPGWSRLSKDQQRATMQQALKTGLDRDLDLCAEVVTPPGWLAFRLRHRGTGILLQVVPGGKFVRGLSDAEEQALRRELGALDDEDARNALSFLDDISATARPVLTVHVQPFFLSPAPLDAGALAKLLGVRCGGLLPGCLTVGEADTVAVALAAQGLRLPSESEYEYAYRAGTSSPFPWGTSRPTSPKSQMNGFGFERMGEMAEVCADGWHITCEGGPTDSLARDPLARPLAARGGSAEVWPWQGSGEWVAMLAAVRSSSADHDGFLRIRPARSFE